MWYGDKKVAKEMTKEQLESKFEFGLEYLNVGNSVLNSNNFKYKDISKKKEPLWPLIMDMFAQGSLEIVNFGVCNISKNDVELLAHSLFENPKGNC